MEFDEDNLASAIPERDPGISVRDQGPTSAEIEKFRRKELALTAVDAVSEVLEADITVRTLERLKDITDAPAIRLTAVRALRCIEAIAKDGSEVVKKVGELNLYHYVEGVVQYGASEKCYLGLMDSLGVSAEGATALYAIRELIAEYTDGTKPGFRTTVDVLRTAGITIYEAVHDPESAVAALYEAGYFVNYSGGRTFDQPIFWHKKVLEESRIVELDDDVDGTMTRGMLEGFRAYFSRHPEEIEDHTDDSTESVQTSFKQTLTETEV